jgi:transcriptional antiterminator NusG
MDYFVVHTYGGREQKVKQSLEATIKSQGLSHLFGAIIVPAENVVRFRKAKRRVEERRLYPGYIIVEMEPVEEVLNLINTTPGVSYLLGRRGKPTPLKKEEVTEILEQMERSKSRLKAEVPFERGESVKVVGGPFTGFTGTVEEIFPERNKVRVMVTIFGRSTPIEISFLEVQSL